MPYLTPTGLAPHLRPLRMPLMLGATVDTVAGALTFKIKVIDARERTPVAGAAVKITTEPPTDISPPMGVTDAEGMAALSLEPEPGASVLYKAYVSKEGYQDILQTVAMVGENVLELPPETMPQDYIEIQLIPPVGSVPVRLFSGKDMVSIAKTDYNGVARFENLHPLKDYSISLHVAGYDPVDMPVDTHNRKIPVTMEAGITEVVLETRVIYSDTGEPFVGQVNLVNEQTGAQVGGKLTDLRGYIGFSVPSPGRGFLFVVPPDDTQMGAKVAAVPGQIVTIPVGMEIASEFPWVPVAIGGAALLVGAILALKG